MLAVAQMDDRRYTDLGDACEGGAEVGELGTPDGLDIGAELVDDLEGAGAPLGILVRPLEQDHWPFLQQLKMSNGARAFLRDDLQNTTHDDLVGPVEISAWGGVRQAISIVELKSRTLDTGCLDIKGEEILEGLLDTGRDDLGGDRGWLVV